MGDPTLEEPAATGDGSMQVLALGMSRTGTASMQAALQMLLGQPAYHAFITFTNPDHARFWSAAFETKYHERGTMYQRREWDQLLQNYGAVTDVPAICFAEELIQAYPEAKVVLVERDIDTWYRSFADGLVPVVTHPINQILRILDRQTMNPVMNMWNYVFADKKGFFRAGTVKELKDNGKFIYKEHYALVRRITPKERILEFDLKDGWKPLCEFLGKPIPVQAFPRLNEGDAVKRSGWIFQKHCLFNVLRRLTLCCFSALALLLAIMWTWPRNG